MDTYEMGNKERARQFSDKQLKKRGAVELEDGRLEVTKQQVDDAHREFEHYDERHKEASKELWREEQEYLAQEKIVKEMAEAGMKEKHNKVLRFIFGCINALDESKNQKISEDIARLPDGFKQKVLDMNNRFKGDLEEICYKLEKILSENYGISPNNRTLIEVGSILKDEKFINYIDLRVNLRQIKDKIGEHKAVISDKYNERSSGVTSAGTPGLSF